MNIESIIPQVPAYSADCLQEIKQHANNMMIIAIQMLSK